ncbi:MAG: alpha-L-rhamnosidase C-terminal domain-containing protein [Opitutaceae bacterium]
MAQAVSPESLVYTRHRPVAIAAAVGKIHPPAIDSAVLAPGAHVTFDFGEELVGTVEFTAETNAGSRLEIIGGEDLEEALLLQDPFPPDHWYHQPHDHFTLTAGASRLATPGRRGFRFATFVAHGPGEIRVSTVTAVLEHAPLQSIGRFACSDELLNRAWEISRRTLQLCLQGFYEDGVKRDGMLWIGDYRVEFLCAWPLFADTALARRSLRMMAACRRPDGALSAVALDAGGHLFPRIAYLGDLSVHGGLHEWVLDNYCADFVCAVWEYVLHTGDLPLARELEPAFEGVLDYLARVSLAQVVPGRGFITDNQPDGKDWWGSRAALGFQLAAAFGDAAQLHERLGNPVRATWCREMRAARLDETITAFGDPAGGQTRDESSDVATRSWHAHAAAFLAGAIDAAQLRAVYRQLQTDPSVRRPMAGFMEFYLLQAWMRAGLIEEALDEMRSYYGQMLRSGATTTWELVDRREPGIDHIQPAGRSHCHGWSAGPAQLLPAHVLGVTPTSPSYRTVDIRPALGGLGWAEGTVPTPHGPIEIRISAHDPGFVDVPSGITATLHLPGRSSLTLTGGRQTLVM